MVCVVVGRKLPKVDPASRLNEKKRILVAYSYTYILTGLVYFILLVCYILARI